MKCNECKHYAETGRFHHPRCKKEIFYSMCKKYKKLITRTCMDRAERCNDFERETIKFVEKELEK